RLPVPPTSLVVRIAPGIAFCGARGGGWFRAGWLDLGDRLSIDLGGPARDGREQPQANERWCETHTQTPSKEVNRFVRRFVAPAQKADAAGIEEAIPRIACFMEVYHIFTIFILYIGRRRLDR